MGFWFTTLAFAALEGVFYAYVQGSAPAARRSCVTRDATRRDATRRRRMARSTAARVNERMTTMTDGATRGRRSFLHVMYGTSVFCCWFMWAVIYMAQMTPLVRPVLQAKES
jgi:V-type H+-transporting ATPase subunit e